MSSRRTVSAGLASTPQAGQPASSASGSLGESHGSRGFTLSGIAAANTMELVGEADLYSAPVEILFEQLSIFCIPQTALLTLRPQGDDELQQGYDKAFGHGWERSVPRESRRPYCAELSRMGPGELQELCAAFGPLRQLAEQLTCKGVMSGFLEMRVRELSLYLLDQVLEHSFLVRDTLKEWEAAVEYQLTKPGAKATSTQSAHLLQLGKTSTSFAEQLEPLFGDLEELAQAI